MKRASAFTLIEVLAAIVLLAVLATASVGLMRSAREDLEHPSTAPRIGVLGAHVDAWIASHEVDVWEEMLETLSDQPVQIMLSEGDQGSVVDASVRLLAERESTASHSDRRLPHRWLMFEWEGVHVLRFLPMEEEAHETDEMDQRPGGEP